MLMQASNMKADEPADMMCLYENDKGMKNTVMGFVRAILCVCRTKPGLRSTPISVKDRIYAVL